MKTLNSLPEKHCVPFLHLLSSFSSVVDGRVLLHLSWLLTNANWSQFVVKKDTSGAACQTIKISHFQSFCKVQAVSVSSSGCHGKRFV